MSDGYDGYVVHPTYRTETIDGKKRPVVTLWGRLKDGRSFLVRKRYEPYFFIPADKAEEAEAALGGLAEIKIEKTKLMSLDRKAVSKLTTVVPMDVPELRKVLEKSGIACFEADIRFAYRAMMDWGVKSLVKIKCDGVPGEDVDIIFEDPELGPVGKEYVPTLSTLSFDIETDKDRGDIYCISCYGKDVKGKERKESLIVSKENIDGAKSFQDEAPMLEAFVRIVKEWDPDLITGWNVIDFDLNHLELRAKKYGIKLGLGRDGSPVRLRIQSNFFRDSTADVNGRVVIDGIAALKGAFIRLQDFRLATAAAEYTDEKKLIEMTGKAKYEEINRLYKEEKKSLLEYNMADARLAHLILENSGVLSLTVKRSLLMGMPPDRVNASIAGLDSLYLRELRDRGFVAPSAGGFDQEDRGVGGFVMQSRPGVYKYVIVCDFKSLYPSIMRTFNIDPLMFTEDKGDFIVAPNGANFRREMGIIPGIIQRFWEARDEAKKAKDELARFAIKIHMNSIYGVLASPNCRFFNRKVGNAITGFAQHFIKLAAEKVKEQGYDVIYGDTDSIFVDLEVDSDDEALKIGKQIEKSINVFLKEYITKEYKLDSFLELEYEKTFIAFVLPKVRGANKGAKKRYAGLIRTKDGKEKITFTGLESVRRDWTDASKEFQHELYRRVFYHEEVAKYVKQYIDEVKAGKHDDKLIYRKALRKGVEEYTKTTPPHVKAARLLDTIESNVIEYYMTTSGPEPIQKCTHALDYDHYIEKQLKPIADSILDLFGTSFDDQLEGSSQSNLFDF